MGLKRSLSIGALIWSVAIHPAEAQSDPDWPPVSRGVGVRLARADSALPVLRGAFLGADRDSLRLELARGASITLPIRGIAYLDESLGRARWRGFLVGVVAGATLGGFTGWLALQKEDPNGLGQFVMTLTGVVLGAPIGGLTGAMLAPERWTRHWNPDRQ